ncbi:MAG TPA: hypothetical protein DG942_01740, partial [Ruminococcaceae bacterium]|nr:hypothetical protein [Oscillospiraceae bacterium]
MKRYVLLFTFTAASIAAIILSGYAGMRSMLHVSAVKVSAGTAEDTVICTGKVESIRGNSIYASKPGIVETVYIKKGEEVTSGQPLMDILPISVSASSNSSSSSSAFSDSNYSGAAQAYAAYLKAMQSGSNSSIPSLPNVNTGDTKTGTKYTLRATASGVVASIAAEAAGAYLTSDSPAVVIRSKDSLQVRLSVDESQAANLRVGQRVQISGVGFKNSSYSGEIKFIASEAKQLISATGQETVVEVLTSVDNPGDDIKPGFTAKAKIITSQRSQVLTVPYEAVGEDASGR